MRKLACIAALVALAAPAEAAGLPNEVSFTLYGVGAASGLASTIAAIVYAAQGRSFDSGWVVAALISSALCLGGAIGLAPFAEDPGALVGVIGNVGLAAFPLYWTGRSALAEVPPGAPLDPSFPHLTLFSMEL